MEKTAGITKRVINEVKIEQQTARFVRIRKFDYSQDRWLPGVKVSHSVRGKELGSLLGL